MSHRGKLIALEGIDGAGKRTQLQLLLRAFVQRGIPCLELSFPHYQGFFGSMAARYLNGEFGPLSAVDPHFSALLYAGDRLEAKPVIEAALNEGKIVIADRYVASNLAHQGARAAPEKREEFLAWLRKLEYEVYGLPAENLVIYLRLPATEGQSRVGRKAARGYTPLRHDLHEANTAHMEAAARMYEHLAQQPNWAIVECGGGMEGTASGPQDIHRRVLAAVDAHIFSPSYSPQAAGSPTGGTLPLTKG
jgi:dTMP kinase